MEPIINPWWFYLLDVIDGLNSVFLIITLILLLVSLGSFIAFMMFNECENNVHEYCYNLLKTITKFFVPLLIFIIIVPSSNTVMKMIIADNITPNNLEIAGDTIEEGVDYIFEKINLVVEESRD